MLLPEIDTQEIQRVYNLFNTRRTLFTYITNFAHKKEQLYLYDFLSFDVIEFEIELKTYNSFIAQQRMFSNMNNLPPDPLIEYFFQECQ